MLRADIDALDVEEAHECPYKSTIPGKMHACGHDAHAAALVGAARILAANKDKFGGTVRLTFQQGEEIGYGARLFVDGGYILVFVKQWRYFINAERQSLIFDGKCCG